MSAHETGWLSLLNDYDGTTSTTKYQTMYFDVEHNLGKHLRELTVHLLGWREHLMDCVGLVGTGFGEQESGSSPVWHRYTGSCIHEIDANTIRVFCSKSHFSDGGSNHRYESRPPMLREAESPSRQPIEYLKAIVTERNSRAGLTGATGATGTGGTTTITLSPNDCRWDSGTTYDSGELVHYKGRVYKSKSHSNVGNQPDLNCTSPAPAGYIYIWEPMTPRLFTTETSPSGLDDDIHIN